MTNIIQVTNLIDLKYILSTNLTTICGFVTNETSDKLKIFIKKFLKQKSKLFPLITFVYMVVSDSDRNTLNILKGELSDYPKFYHIRNGKDILVMVNSADVESIEESFKNVEPYYIDDMKNESNKSNEDSQNQKDNESIEDNEQKELDKLLLLNKTRDELLEETINDIQRRKEMEAI